MITGHSSSVEGKTGPGPAAAAKLGPATHGRGTHRHRKEVVREGEFGDFSSTHMEVVAAGALLVLLVLGVLLIINGLMG